MNKKVVALGITVILAVSILVSGIAIVSDSNNGDGEIKIPDVSGKWNLAYIEHACFIDDSTKELITDADQVKIVDHYVNPDDSVAVINVSKVGDHGFTGSFKGNKMSAIHGTLNGAAIKFIVEVPGFLCIFEGVAKEDNYLSVTMTALKIAESGSDTVVSGVNYMLFIRDGADPVPIRSDYFDMRIMKAGEHIRSVLHDVEDFSGEKTGRGTDIGSELRYVKSHSMISIFSVIDRDGNHLGIQAVVTMGTTPNGTVSGVIAGNMTSPLDSTSNWTFTGNVVVANGRATFFHHHHMGDPSKIPAFVEIEYNVPYHKGGKITPVYLQEGCDYEGKITVKSDSGVNTFNIIKRFEVYDNTFYSEGPIPYGGKTAVWFGEMYGHTLDLYLIVGEHYEGHLTGHIDRDGSIHIFGFVMDIQARSPAFIDMFLEAKKV